MRVRRKTFAKQNSYIHKNNNNDNNSNDNDSYTETNHNIVQFVT